MAVPRGFNNYAGYDSSLNARAQGEPMSTYKQRPSSRVQINNLPAGFTTDAIDQILDGCGTVKKASLLNGESGQFVKVIFDSPEEAQKAVERLNETNYQGSSLRAEMITSNPSNGRFNRGGSMGGGGGGGGNRYGNGRQRNSLPQLGGTSRGGGSYSPLRILVPSEYVGAIIGRKGATIRSITTRCKARVDVHGKENSGLIEKVISIFGQPENCTSACKEILLVMQQEATANSRGETMLKMLCDDRFCGRIIGKEGKMIKKIRDDTNTKITVSNAQEMAAFFPDRVIAIRGAVDGMSQAEAAISAKLNECIEHEQQQANNMGSMMTSLGTNASYYPYNRPYDMPVQQQGYYSHNMYMSGGAVGPMSSPPVVGGHIGGGGGATEMCQIGVPNAAVGAIIGTSGSNIKQLMRESGAFANIESKKDGDPGIERLVCIRGTADACWRASYMVFEKLKLEGFSGNDEVRLRTIIKIPKPIVGRIIGKSGKTVREIQRGTGAMIKLPEEQSVQGEEVAVEVFGNFMATQTAQARIRALVSQTQQQNSSNGGGVPSYRGGRRAGSVPNQMSQGDGVAVQN